MSRGVLLFNMGTSCLARIAVALHSLRKHYAGDVTIIHGGDEGARECSNIAYARKAVEPEVERALPGFQRNAKIRAWAAARRLANFKRVEFTVPPGHARALLCKTQLHLHTPYDTSILLDADTVTLGDITPIFEAAEAGGFAVAQFSDWKTTGRIRKRIEEWRPIVGDKWTDEALAYGPAINTGVYGFRRDSKLMADWYEIAVKNRAGFIPDETCCQVMLPRYPHVILPARFNVSCRYGSLDDAVVVHMHGRKHCRIEGGRILNNADIWLREFEQIRHRDEVQAVIKHDRQLRQNLPRWDKREELSLTDGGDDA